MKPFSDTFPSQTTPAAQAEPVAQAKPATTPTNAKALPPKPNGKTKVSETVANCGSNRKNSTEKIKINNGQFKVVCHYYQKTYCANSKGCGNTNLLNHVPNCVKNSNRNALKRQQTLAFEPTLNGEERFQLVPIAFIVESFRKSLK